MHQFLGLTLEEWGIMSGMATAMVGVIVALFRLLVVTPLKDSIDHVAIELKDFRSSANAEHDVFDDRLDDHEHRILILEDRNKRSN